MSDRIDFLESMQKLDVKDGDIIVLRYGAKLSKETSTNLRDAIQEIIKGFGFNVKAMILEDGMDIGILRKKEGV